ncbi:hypothetical protein SEPCBS119000_001754 [Sporothrix epigloea]|uniref:Golgi to ER traffic protein 2 n=1 Tax=Sporothrix epigloea TaxID=1892477 RepID=A0ABP0DCF6_9PEZI
MTESASPSLTPEDAAAAQARRRKERREAKIKAGGSARLNKITGLGGGLQREPAAPKPTPSTEHGDPDEVDISEHYYQPAGKPRPIDASSLPHMATSDAQMRQLLLAQQLQQQQQQQQPPLNPFLFGDTAGSNDPFGMGGMGGFGTGGPSGEGAEGDPMAAMLSQMMQAMGGGAGGPGGAGGGFPGIPDMAGGFPSFPGFPGMGAPGQQEARATIPSTRAALWRLVHFAVAVALGLYVALATPFQGTRAEYDLAAASHSGNADGMVYGTADFALHKRYFFYAFATAETILLTSRIFLERGGRGGVLGGNSASGMVGMAMSFLPPGIKRNIEIAMRYWQIFSTVRSDLMVCVFVLGVCAWWRS